MSGIAAGILKGYDPLLNIVLDGTVEYLQGKNSQHGSCTIIGTSSYGSDSSVSSTAIPVGVVLSVHYLHHVTDTDLTCKSL